MIGLDERDDRTGGLTQAEMIARHRREQERQQEEKRLTPERLAERVRRLGRQNTPRVPFQFLNWQ